MDGEYVVLLREFADKLVESEWPEEIEPFVDDVVAEVAETIAYYVGRAEAETEDEFLTARNEGGSGANAASQALRIRLGLGNVGADQ